jgi:hypothetical protein
MLAAGLTLALAAPALAQNSQGQSPTSGQNPANVRQQVRQNLEAAGYTDIKVMPESFLVRAKDRSGNPVMMIINPDSVTAVTTLSGSASGNSMVSTSGNSMGSTSGGSSGNSMGSASGNTMGSASGNSMGSTSGDRVASSQALDLTTQQKQQIAQAVASQPSEQAPANFQPSVGQKVPSSLTLKSFPSSAESELPASLQGDQYAKLGNNKIIIVDPSSREVVGVVNQNSAD